jgi:hypothetical protein
MPRGSLSFMRAAHHPPSGLGAPLNGGYSALIAATRAFSEALASPNNIEQFGS